MNALKNSILEVCADSAESALIAYKAGADRLELCSNLIIGGTTPSPCLFQEIKKNCGIGIHILIRPRFGDFCYSDHEFHVMKEEVKMFQKLGAEGIAIGILQPDGNLNLKQMEEILGYAKGMSVTLHRAFDVCADPFKTLEEAKQLGIHTILTSGQKNNCVEGKELITRLVDKSMGAIDILVGGGVNAEVIEELLPITGAAAYHMSGKIPKDSSMLYRKEGVNMGLSSLSEFEIWQTDGKKIKDAAAVLRQSRCKN